MPTTRSVIAIAKTASLKYATDCVSRSYPIGAGWWGAAGCLGLVRSERLIHDHLVQRTRVGGADPHLSVAVSGSTAVIGAYGRDSFTGSAYVVVDV
jgi:hypothetical protein